jgi:hypothetical protein
LEPPSQDSVLSCDATEKRFQGALWALFRRFERLARQRVKTLARRHDKCWEELELEAREAPHRMLTYADVC